MEIILLLFQFGWFLYHFLTWLLWLGFLVLCWIGVVRGIVLFFLILEKRDVLAVSVSYTAFIMLEYVLSMSSFHWDDHLIFLFCSFNVVYHIYWCVCAELLPGRHPGWSWCLIPLTCYWIWFASILLRIYVPIFKWVTELNWFVKDIGL